MSSTDSAGIQDVEIILRFQLKIDEVEQVTCVYSPDLPLVRKEDEDLIRLGKQSVVQLIGRDDCRFIVKEDIVKLQHRMMTTRQRWRGKSFDFYLIGHEHLYGFRKPGEDERTARMRMSMNY